MSIRHSVSRGGPHVVGSGWISNNTSVQATEAPNLSVEAARSFKRAAKSRTAEEIECKPENFRKNDTGRKLIAQELQKLRMLDEAAFGENALVLTQARSEMTLYSSPGRKRRAKSCS